MSDAATPRRYPSVDSLARSLAATGLPHPILVDIARAAIERRDPDSALVDAHRVERTLLTRVVNATGVLLHTNLGRAPVGVDLAARPTTVELDLESGGRGSRNRGIGLLLARACGAEAAIAVNNNAAAVLLALAAIASGRDVLVSRGEAVEIGGEFRIPDVLEQSGARLIDVGTTNRTRGADYARAIARPGTDVAAILKVHPSNYTIAGFVESASIAEIAELGVPVVADLGSGLLDARVPWLDGPPPAWLEGEPGVVQAIESGAALVTFSGDKLFGGPQAGIIAGRADLVERCARHPLARAVRCGSLVLSALQDTALAYLDRRAGTDVAFWRMASLPVDVLRGRAEAIVDATGAGTCVPTEAVAGAGSAPGAAIASVGIAIAGDQLGRLRDRVVPVIARVRDARTVLDLRSVEPDDDAEIAAALRSLRT